MLRSIPDCGGTEHTTHSTHSHALMSGPLGALWLCAGDGERPGPAAALTGPAAESSVCSSKWRHVRPVRLQLGPGRFPEAAEASPCLSAHRGERQGAPHGARA